MRVESPTPCKNGGWLHKIGGDVPVHRFHKPVPQQPSIDATRMMKEWAEETTVPMLDMLAETLGVTHESLFMLGFAWSKLYEAWAVPMRDGIGAMIGIQLRSPDGSKRCVTGSHLGLFVPQHVRRMKRLFISEGASDTAALLSLGLLAIGRPSCSSRTDWICETAARLGCREVVIVSDNDDPGVRGAEQLQEVIPVASSLWLPPCKDVRTFLTCGGTRESIESYVNQLVWKRPSTAVSQEDIP